MLSKHHLKHYKEDSSFTDYMEQQSVHRYKELILPRFKTIKALGQDVQKVDSFTPFIMERDDMNRICRASPMIKKINNMLSTPKQHPNPTILTKKPSITLKLHPKVTHSPQPEPHWYYNSSYLPPKRESKIKPHKILNYSPKPLAKLGTSTDSQDNSRGAINNILSERSRITRRSSRSPNKFLSEEERIRKQLLQQQQSYKTIDTSEEPKIKKGWQLPTSLTQPYLERAMKATKQDLFLQPDMEYQFSNELNEMFIHKKQHIKNLQKKIKDWGETKTDKQLVELQECADFVLSKYRE